MVIARVRIVAVESTGTLALAVLSCRMTWAPIEPLGSRIGFISETVPTL